MSERDDEEQELIAAAESIVWQQWRIERILQNVGWPDHGHLSVIEHTHVTTLANHPRCVVCSLEMEDW